MIQPFDTNELAKRIELNFRRLAEGDYYQAREIFSPKEYDWYGDKEGRALLAFASHYKISGNKIPCMDRMMEQLSDHLNEDGYFGPILEIVHEQQLSGHSWLLRGLCEHYQLFGDSASLTVLRRITENLYLPKKGRFSSYPIDRSSKEEGGVSGSSDKTACADWILSSDIGCAFMSIDGLSHVYCLTRDAALKELLDEMISVFLAIDKCRLKAQTHCSLTAARGMIRMYHETKSAYYLDGAKAIFDLYVRGGGMSATYQNLNWWGRPDSWTEPCAIVDSLMLAAELYKATGKEEYRRYAARIYHNGLATAQRANGGAGTDSVVVDGVEDTLYSKMYEAFFCCTMRLAEGLWYIHQNKDLFAAKTEGRVTRCGRTYADGDLLYAEVSGGAEAFAEKTVEIDGHRLSPLVKYYQLPDELLASSRQKILF